MLKITLHCKNISQIKPQTDTREVLVYVTYINSTWPHAPINSEQEKQNVCAVSALGKAPYKSGQWIAGLIDKSGRLRADTGACL